MKFATRHGTTVFAALFALSLGACGSAEYRHDYQSMAAPIEVIESNFMESTNDAEIVYLEIPAQVYGATLGA